MVQMNDMLQVCYNIYEFVAGGSRLVEMHRGLRTRITSAGDHLVRRNDHIHRYVIRAHWDLARG